MKILAFVLLFGFAFEVAHAQKYMVISGKRKRVMYKAGDRIKFKLKTEKQYHQSTIVSVMDTALQFKNYRIAFDEIDKVDTRRKRTGAFNWHQVGALIQVAGIGYILLDQFNKTLIQGNPWEFEPEVWITGAAIFAGGTILRFLDPRKLKIGLKYHIKYLEIPKEEVQENKSL
jgi:hypothetical protein